MKFQTMYDPFPPYFEVCEESETETAGYIPTDKLIQQYNEAGIKLEINRSFQFPGDEEVPDDYMPVNFASRLDALMLDADVKKRLMKHLEEVKKQYGKEDGKEEPPVVKEEPPVVAGVDNGST